MKVALGIAFISAVVGFLLLRWVEPSTQLSMLGVIERIAPVVFGILGVWIAVLDPTVILKHTPSQSPNEREQLALQFSPLLIDATLVFVGVVTLRFIEPALPKELLAFWWAKGVLGTVVTFFYIFEMTILLRTLLPVFYATRKARENVIKRKFY